MERAMSILKSMQWSIHFAHDKTSVYIPTRRKLHKTKSNFITWHTRRKIPSISSLNSWNTSENLSYLWHIYRKPREKHMSHVFCSREPYHRGPKTTNRGRGRNLSCSRWIMAFNITLLGWSIAPDKTYSKGISACVRLYNAVAKVIMTLPLLLEFVRFPFFLLLFPFYS